MSEQNTANDYAVAKYLNERVVAFFALVADYYHNDLPDLTDINRSYVLLVNELKQLYDRNPELSRIQEKICWRTFETIDAIDPYTLYEYSDDYRNHGNDHISKVNSLCIVAGKEEPDLTPELKKILDEANKNVTTFMAELDKIKPDTKDWYIPKYTFTMTNAGVLLVNGVPDMLKVNKTQAGSANTKLLEEALRHSDGKPYKSTVSITRTLSTALSELGFAGVFRKLFFPPVHNKGQNELVFRHEITLEQVKAEGIDTHNLDLKLKQAGADYEKIVSVPF